MRLFFGMEIVSPWPEHLPDGRIIETENRHLTLAFLGETNTPDLDSFPKPSFSTGIGGIFNEPIFLKNVVAWHVNWFGDEVVEYQKTVAKHFHLSEKFLSHVTMSRKPYNVEDWKKSFQPLPMYAKNIHLYESLGYSKYKVLWTHPILPPFEDIEHTADLAFLVRREHYLNAQLALAFHFPLLLRYYDDRKIESLDEIVSALNLLIARADGEIGCPFKAVSFHGTDEDKDEWEMVVDV